MLKKEIISFIKRLLLFLITLAVADQLLGFLLRKTYFSQQQGFDYQCTHAIRDTRAGTLVLGSSRALNIVDPAVIRGRLNDSCYNAGMEGQSVLYQYAILQAVLNRYTPGRVILSVDAGNFARDTRSYDRLARLLPYYRDHPEIRETVHLKGGWEQLKMLSGIYPFNSKMLDIFRAHTGRNLAEQGVDGFIGLNKNVAGPPLQVDYGLTKEIDTLKLNRYRRIINDCRKTGVRLYIICPPYRIESKGADTSLILARKLADEAGVPFLDFSADRSFVDHTEWFADFRHLNTRGARIFTDTLAGRIRALEQDRLP